MELTDTIVHPTDTVIKQPALTRLSEVDRLKLEVVSLKLMNIGHHFDKLMAERSKCSRQFDELRKEYVERYGIDIASTRIDEEGSFCGPLLPQQTPRIQGQITEPGMKVRV